MSRDINNIAFVQLLKVEEELHCEGIMAFVKSLRGKKRNTVNIYKCWDNVMIAFVLWLRQEEIQ